MTNEVGAPEYGLIYIYEEVTQVDKQAASAYILSWQQIMQAVF